MTKNYLIERIPVYIIFSLIILMSTGCSKENMDNELIKESNITIKDGRLVFKDQEVYQEHVNWIVENQMNEKLIIDKNKSMGFKSMSEIYYEGINLMDETALNAYLKTYPNVYETIKLDNSIFYKLETCSVIGYLANENGLFQIGDRIIRVTYDYNYEIPDGDESKIEFLFEDQEEIKSEGIIVTKALLNNPDSKNQYSYKTDYFSNDRYRIVGRLWAYTIESAIFYEAETNAQKRTLGVWLPSFLTVHVSNLSGYAGYSPTPSIYIDAYSKSATQTVKKVFLFGSFPPIDFNYSCCEVRHYGISTKLGEAEIDYYDAI